MSIDRDVTDDLITTLEDGRKGFEAGARRLRENGRVELAEEFESYAAQRAIFVDELSALAGVYGDDVDESGSMLGTVHRGWLTVMDAISGSSVDGVLGAAVEGEQYTADRFLEALDADLSENLRTIVGRQAIEVANARTFVEALHAG